MTSVTGVFAQPDGATRAAERLRELEHQGAIRLFMPGEHGEPVETSVIAEPSPWPRVLAWSIGLALLCAWISVSIGDRTVYAVVGLATGAIAGLLLGTWLGGEAHVRNLHPHLRAGYAQLVRRGRAVVVAELKSSDRVDAVRHMLEEEGAYVVIGHWPITPVESPPRRPA
jgi:hypothetical protein